MSKIQTKTQKSIFAVNNTQVLCVRTKQSHTDIEQQWQVLKKEISSEFNVFLKHKLWVEKSSTFADSDAAKKRLIKETNRPVSANQGSTRVSLLVYADGIVDLVIVAAFGKINKSKLLNFSQQLLTSSDKTDTNTELNEKSLLTTFHTFNNGAANNHTQQNHGHDQIVLNGVTSDAVLLSVIAMAMNRFSISHLDNILQYKSENQSENECESQSESQSETVVNQIKNVELLSQKIILPTLKQQSISEIAQIIEQQNNQETQLSRSPGEHQAPQENTVSLVWDTAIDNIQSDAMSVQYSPCSKPLSPLTFIASRAEGSEILLTLMFDKKTYSTDFIRRFLSAIELFANESKIDPAQSMEGLNMMTTVEQKAIVNLGTTVPQINNPFRIDHRFSELAKVQPEKIAICFESTRMTYQQLEVKANQVAHGLIDKGVAKGEHVGICLSRSIDTVVAMLAILKVGAVYVPIDPNYPVERISYTCLDGNLKFIISELADIPEVAQEQILDANVFFESCYALSSNSPSVQNLSEDDAAYIIYTSGSTGKPKGVVIPHKNVSSLISETFANFNFSNEDVWTLFHSTAFDFSVWEIWGPLLTGARLVVVPYWTSRQVDLFAQLMRDEQVTILNQTPSAFLSLIEEDEKLSVGSSLRLVIFGGEALDARALQPWFDRHPETQCQLVNMYGITETTVHVTAKVLSRRDTIADTRSVGRAIPGWSVYVLDENQNILPPGIAGEIYVGGAGVALCYHNKPELTAERFMKNPFQAGMMYRSGDKGEMLENGELRHLGRLDDQIKLRGFRIELGEIRNILLSLSGVTAAAVTFTQDNPSDPATARLDTYVMLENISIEDVVAHSQRFLPQHMQSNGYFQVSEMPLTPNGKLDLKRIKEKVILNKQQTIEVKAENIRPLAANDTKPQAGMQTETQEKANQSNDEDTPRLEDRLLNIWQDILNKPVATQDNFFDLGGNSLYAIRISSAMKKVGLPALNMRELYIHQTIDNLANVLRGQQAVA